MVYLLKKVKKRNLIELIIQICIFIFLFIPGMFIKEYWISNGNFSDGHRHAVALDEQVSFFHKITNVLSGGHQVLGWIIVVLFFLGIAVYAFQYISDEKHSNLFITLFIPGIELILLWFYSFLIYDNHNGRETWKYWISYEPSAFFYLSVAALLSLFTVTVLGYIKVKKRGVKESESDFSSTKDTLENLKVLFDSGIITEEEFSEKKKQILGL